MYVGQKGHMNEGTLVRNCVMCGEECPLVVAKKDAPKDARRTSFLCTCVEYAQYVMIEYGKFWIASWKSSTAISADVGIHGHAFIVKEGC